MSNHTVREEIHDGFSSSRWSVSTVKEATLHPISLRLYADAPYVAELFCDDLWHQIVHPANAAQRSLAHPILAKGHGGYYLPGSASDLLLHTSCAIALCPALAQHLPADSDAFDFGPPLPHDLLECSMGRHLTMMPYWARLELATQRHLAAGFSHALFADIERCIENIRVERMSDLLREAGADDDAVRLIEKMHRFWQRAGCRGIPLTAGFKILIKLYLKAADDWLHREGITFVRLQDDFRLFCNGQDEAHDALSILSDAVAICGLTLNKNKTYVFTQSQFRYSMKRQWLGWKRTLSDGVGRPMLSDALRFPTLRPSALRLLRLLYGHAWNPA